MSNTFVKLPKRGDIVVKDIATKTPHYISQDTFVLADLDQTTYEIVGVVYYRKAKDVGVVYKTNATSLKYMSRAWWYLSGYTLDGTARTGVISICTSASTGTSIDKTISYNATTLADFVSQLNTAFLADSDFVAQDWYANIEDDGETVRVHCNFTFYQQSSDSAKSGFTLTSMSPEISALANIRRKHGGNGGEGAISNMARALTYFKADTSSSSYNPSSDVTDIKRGYPVCLPAYLGTSSYQSEHCAKLREVYGEGEEGWKLFMQSCLPVYPTDFGNMGMINGKERCAELVAHTFVSNKVTTETTCCPAANYANTIASTTVESGEFWLPTTRELAMVLDGVEYNTTSDRNADSLNKGLNLIGGSAVSNGAGWWSCLRCSSYSAWCSGGVNGFFNGYYGVYGAYGSVPVSNYRLA